MAEVDSQNMDSLILVGIGASAGGLEAISKLLSRLEPNIDCAIVVLQHLSPNYKSMMPELLGRETRLTVTPLSDKTKPRPGNVYVVPPNRNATISNGLIHLVEASPESTPRPSINNFFQSMAVDKGVHAIGIILSGTGSDGTHGLQAIQAAGGTTLIQTPETAKYEGMPSSAKEQGVADFVLPIDDIAAKLMTLVRITAKDSPGSRSAIDSILETLKTDTGLDFSGYKVGTLVRRIRRRVAALGATDLESYLEYIKTTPGESDLLAKEIMVSVTSFFRDDTAIQALRTQLSERIQRLHPHEEMRAWVAGCATGEEAYTIAMLILDAQRMSDASNPIQIFATDIDEDALSVARRGVYSDLAVSTIPADFIDRYMIKRGDDQYEVNKSLRDIVVFARHNLIADPPFLRLALVSCRNVLIYFDSPLQAKVLQRLNFALKDNGLLFLGRSESIAQADSRFHYLDRRERLFCKTSSISAEQAESPMSNTLNMFQMRRKESTSLIADAAADNLGIAALLCSPEGLILQTLGTIQQFFEYRAGHPYPSLMEGLHSAFKSHAIALLHKWQKNHESQRSGLINFKDESWRMSFSSVPGDREERLLVMIAPASPPLSDTTDTLREALSSQAYSDELQVTHEQLQSLVEELATANEEMQSLNEEAQASNEELQATNEELEAANEELQATNEELISVNEELGVRTSELKTLNQEYSHLYDSFDFPVMVFNSSLRLTRFNAAAGQRFGLAYSRSPNDAMSILLPEYLGQLASYLKDALADRRKKEFTTRDGERYFHIIVSPALQDNEDIDFLVVNVIDVTDIQHTKNQLDESKARLQTIMQNTTVLISMKDLRGNYLYANTAFLERFDIDEEHYLKQSDFDLLPESLAAQIWASDLGAIRTLKMQRSTATIDTQDGLRYFASRHQVLRDHTGKPDMLIVEMEDITEQRKADDKLKIAAKVFQQAGEAIVVTDDQSEILSTNDAFSRITGYSEKESVGKRIGHLLNSGRHNDEFFKSLWKSLNEAGHWQGEIWNKRKNGEIFPEWLTITRVLNQQDQTDYYIAVFADITNLKESQSQIEFLATHDTLTGLPNRTLFLDRLENAIARSKRSDQQLAVLFLDLDNFKSINDTLGHDTGDKLLLKVAQTLLSKLRDEDTVARQGGDEFTILLNNCEPHYAEEVAQRALEGLSEPVEIDGRRIFSSASLGLSFYPDDAEDSLGLLKAADTALYRAKEAGRNHYCFFHSDMRDTLIRQSNLEGSLQDALRNRHFRLVYQPKVTPADHEVIGAEALLRWYDPNSGNDISPAEFIPIAEKGSSIVDISHLVIDMLAHQMARWQSQGLQIPPVSFNVSARCLKLENFSEEVVRIIDGYLVPPDRLQVEITESSLMGDSRNARQNLQVFKDKGLGISIDDFGTGYSSLSYLKQLPLDELKIDKGFVDGLGDDENDEAICQAVLSISRALNLKVVAEGVETTQQAQWLQENGCDYLQGYLFYKPLEIVEFEKLLTHKVTP